MNRRDFLGFSAGTALTAVLASVGDPGLVRLATAAEVERLKRPPEGLPLSAAGGLVLQVRLYRMSARAPESLLDVHVNARGGGFDWHAWPGEEIVLDSTGNCLRSMQVKTEIIERSGGLVYSDPRLGRVRNA